MTLAQVFEEQFRGDIRFRGAEYLKEEKVQLTRVTTEQVFAQVTDGEEFATHLLRDDGQLKMACSCHEKRGVTNCKHLWATLLMVDNSGVVSATVKPGHIPPFVVEDEPLFSDDELDEEFFEGDANRDVYTPPPRARLAREATIEKLRPWEAQLRTLSTAFHERTAVAKEKAPRERELYFEIDVPQSGDRGTIVIQTSQRQRRTNGQWGKLKPLKVRTGHLEGIEHEDDRRILAFLAGGTAERTSWYAQQAEAQGAIFRYALSYDLAQIVLPMICATGRTLIMGEDLGQTEYIQWDDGPAWELCIDVALDDETPQWELEGHLRRGDEVMTLREPNLIVPGGFVLAHHRLARLQDFGSFEWVGMLRNGTTVQVPQEEGQDLVDKLLDLPQLPRLELPPELKLEEVKSAPIPHLTLHTPRGVRWQHERLQGEVTFEYLGTRIPSSSPQGAIVQRDQGRCVVRDKPQEETQWLDLQGSGFRRLSNTHRGRFDVEIPAKALGPGVRGLIKKGWQIHADGQRVYQPGAMEFEVKTGLDWFELHARVDFEGRTVPFPELLAALARGDATVRLSDGSLGILSEEWFKQFGLLSTLGQAEGDHVRFTQSQAGLLDALLAAQDTVLYDAHFEVVREKLKNFKGIQIVEEPAGFTGELRPYQREGFGWLKFLQDFSFGGCLADDMGLGKTIQLLSLLQERKNHSADHLPTLVVVPKSLIFNWMSEATKFTPGLRLIEYTGLSRARFRKKFAKADLVLTTYGTIRRDIIALKEVKFDYVVLDEAQAIKNAGSQVAKACRLLQGRHRLALSGTPIENRLADLWSIFEFLNPGMLGRAGAFRVQTSEIGDDESRRLLSRALKPFILRRTKKEVAKDLPDKIEQTITCQMGKEQLALYTELRDHYRNSLITMVKQQGLAKSKIHVLEALLRLRQAACHPGLLDPAKKGESSAKLDALNLHLTELLAEGHKALVFSQFTSMLAIVKEHLDQKGIVYEYLDGQTRDRKARVERFQTDTDCGVFLISLKAGGLGLNLTAADYVFLLDPWWNPAVEMQAIDRAHRIGQTRQVFAYRLICHNTVEEKIAELQGRKKELADAILQADNQLIQDLTTEDLELLLS